MLKIKKRKIIILGVLLLTTVHLFAQKSESLQLDIEEGEYWWGGLSAFGNAMPYDANTKITRDLWGNRAKNQAESLLMSNKGRYVWSEEPIKYTFENGKIDISTRDGVILHGDAGENLKDAYKYCVQNFFPPNGKIPDESLFIKPQFNSWIELQYNQNEDAILTYAQHILDNGYDPGVLMIDDTWQENYGVWDFAPRKFKHPKEMMDTLHKMGFKVMLWICPFVSADSIEFRYLAKEGLLILDPQKTEEVMWSNTRDKAAIIRWWNGASACLDLSNPKAREWFKSKLDFLQTEYGVDGFKFDAGDPDFYVNDVVSLHAKSPNDHTAYFGQIGLDYPLNEYRASWKMAGLPLVQRLRDKWHSWDDLQKLIPDLTSQSLMGYAYTCPDMIGGGQVSAFQTASTLDQELVVRSAQVHALMPMMQFSAAPWRILTPENAKLCLEASKLHVKMGSLIMQLAEKASKTGEPIVSPMALAFPDNGYETIKDQFMLGDAILVAPIVEKNTYKRKVVLPNGRWKADDGNVYKGNKTIEIDAPLDRLPYFQKIK